jgi:hypothetical protein
MRAMLPIALLGLALMLGAYFGPKLLARLRLFFSYPAYGTSALCPHCVRPLPEPESHVCPACLLPISGFAATDPILRILSVGALCRQGSRRLVGAGLVGVSAFALLVVGFALSLALEGLYVPALRSLLVGSPWLIVLFKGLSTRVRPFGGA